MSRKLFEKVAFQMNSPKTFTFHYLDASIITRSNQRVLQLADFKLIFQTDYFSYSAQQEIYVVLRVLRSFEQKKGSKIYQKEICHQKKGSKIYQKENFQAS